MSGAAQTTDRRTVACDRECVVVVPIFNAPHDVARCLDALLEKTSEASRILLMNDASTDPRIGDLVADAAARDSRVGIIVNPVNLGYTATVNRGLRASSPGHVAILNSDTEVTRGWLGRMLDLLRVKARCGDRDPGVQRRGRILGAGAER